MPDSSAPHLWRKITREPHVDRSPLRGDVETDFLVVGGGYTGLSAALRMAESAARVVLESGEIGSAASGRNNGFVMSNHSRATPAEVVERFGCQRGERYNALVAGAARELFDWIAANDIHCDSIETGWLQPAHSAAAVDRMRRIYDGWRHYGADVRWLDRAEVSQRLGSSAYFAAWETVSAGHLNPYALAHGLARVAAGAGALIAERSTVRVIVPCGRKWRALTDSGSVIATQVLLATNAATTNIWPNLSRTLIPVRVYRVATQPLPSHLRSGILKGNPAVSDTRRDLRAFHFDAHGRMVTGGTLATWINARSRGERAATRMLEATFPSLRGQVRMEEYWEGTLAVTMDRFPRLARLAPGVAFAGIYSGRGVALSNALGRRVGDWLLGNTPDDCMPLPVSEPPQVPMHRIAVQVARRIHPWNRLRDRLDRTTRRTTDR